MLLGLIIVSGVLSEQSIRRVRVEPVLPDELFAGQLALFGARVANRKRWRASYSITVEGVGSSHRAYLAKLEPGAERLITWQETPRARGRWRLASFKVATRFPFGLFVKTTQLAPKREVVVYPAIGPISADRRRELDGAGGPPPPRPGAGTARPAPRPAPWLGPPSAPRRRGPGAPRRTHGSARSAWRWAERVAPPGAPPRDAPPRVRRSRGPAPRGAGRRWRRPGGRRRRGRDEIGRAHV